MRKCKGSFTVEAAFILPIIFACIVVVIEVSVSLREEVCSQVEIQMEKEPFDMIKATYRREYIKELLGEFYED